jgi:hypothetical protein
LQFFALLPVASANSGGKERLALAYVIVEKLGMSKTVKDLAVSFTQSYLEQRKGFTLVLLWMKLPTIRRLALGTISRNLFGLWRHGRP